jgi:predicted nuclease with TOPRIM domain
MHLAGCCQRARGCLECQQSEEACADDRPSQYVDQMNESDWSVLRRLADDGNEEAADRLTELAAERGDLDELRRLVDNGNENAADRLTELAAERGDLDELQRLSDQGNENAADRLTELIRNIK